MGGAFSLWDVESGNLVAESTDAGEMLRLVTALVEANGPEYVDDLDLAWVTDSGDATHVATGMALSALAQGYAHPRRWSRRARPVARRRAVIRSVQREPIAS
jgi:hypothetical protein